LRKLSTDGVQKQLVSNPYKLNNSEIPKGWNNDMEKIYRIPGAFVLILLLTAIGVLAVNNWSLRRELAGVRLVNTGLTEWIARIEQGQRGTVEYIQREVSKLDKEFSDRLSAQKRGIEGMAGTLQLLREWADRHRNLEQAIIERLTPSAGN
jgi:hypothetical protein